MPKKDPPRRLRFHEIRQVKGMQEIHIHMGTFDFGVNVAVGPYKKLPGYVRHKFEDPKIPDAYFFDDGYTPRGKHVFNKEFCPIIWIPRIPKTPREHATLAHEALHSVFDLMDWTGMSINTATEEVVTHAMAFIVTTVLETRRK